MKKIRKQLGSGSILVEGIWLYSHVANTNSCVMIRFLGSYYVLIAAGKWRSTIHFDILLGCVWSCLIFFFSNFLLFLLGGGDGSCLVNFHCKIEWNIILLMLILAKIWFDLNIFKSQHPELAWSCMLHLDIFFMLIDEGLGISFFFSIRVKFSHGLWRG